MVIVGYLEASLASLHWMPVALPSMSWDNQKCPQTFSKATCGAKSLPPEIHCLQGIVTVCILESESWGNGSMSKIEEKEKFKEE